ncbi:MAG: anti-sigma factor [Chitinophagaceae bacterium]
MNTQEYISSGIVESYVLGLASQEEAAEFERACDTYPEVRAAREAFELSLEQQLLANAVPPPAGLLDDIFAAAGINNQPTTVEIDPNGSPRFPEDPVAPQTPVVKMQKAPSFGWMAAAAMILLIGSAALNFYLYRQYEGVKAEQAALASQNKEVMDRIAEAEQSLALLKDPANLPVIMNGVGNSPDAKATVYWNTNTKDVYLLVNNLPVPEAGKQYQLWALVDGKPVDAGVFEVDPAGNLVTKMKNIPHAQAFAVTLEKKGGSPTPTLTAMYVMGQI